jgi:hypothetical protein
MKHWLIGILLVGLSGVALGRSPLTPRERVEASMLVTGTLVVAPDGSVASYTLDHPEKLPAPVAQLAKQAVPYWRFQPVLLQGQPVRAKSTMTLRVVARHSDATHFVVAIRGATFGSSSQAKKLAYRKRMPPYYPRQAVQARVSGTVYLLVRVDVQGHVDDVAAEQVNLYVMGSEHQLEPWRRMLAQVSIRAAHHWEFNPAYAPSSMHDGHWIARIPVRFNLNGEYGPLRPVVYGRWNAYMPGPHEQVPWAPQDKLKGSNADAISDGSIAILGQGLRLLTPLGSS